MTKFQISVDLGHGFTKYKGGRFASAYDPIALTMSATRDEVHNIVYNGANFQIGTGRNFHGDDRFFTEAYKMCLLTAIVLSVPKAQRAYIECDVMVGLPLSKIADISDKLIRHVESWGLQEITVDGKKSVVKVDTCQVFVEGAYCIKEPKEGDVLTVDIGAQTVNVIKWQDGVAVAELPLTKSVHALMSDIMAFVNGSVAGAAYDNIETIERKVFNKDMTKINQVETDISKHKAVIEAFVANMHSAIHQRFDLASIDEIVFMGGGSILLREYLEYKFPTAEFVDNAQFVNQEIFELVLEEDEEE